MKRMIDQIQANGGEPRVENSLFFFLKFISSVVPTIEHDFTIELEMDWKRINIFAQILQI